MLRGKIGNIMSYRIPLLLLVLAALLVPRAASGGQVTPADPKYDPASSVEFSAVVVELRDVARGNAMHGLHLIVENGRETIDVYLAPLEFMKQFDLTFAKGDRVQVLGSRVRPSATALVLAREVRRQNQTVYLRDAVGTPNWTAGT
jgi:hypothetical protein